MNAINSTTNQTSNMSAPADGMLDQIATALQNLNQAVATAVDAGVTVEIKRTCRYHGSGAWGDQMTPVVVEQRT